MKTAPRFYESQAAQQSERKVSSSFDEQPGEIAWCEY